MSGPEGVEIAQLSPNRCHGKALNSWVCSLGMLF